jgi:hypothetical protein
MEYIIMYKSMLTVLLAEFKQNNPLNPSKTTTAGSMPKDSLVNVEKASEESKFDKEKLCYLLKKQRNNTLRQDMLFKANEKLINSVILHSNIIRGIKKCEAENTNLEKEIEKRANKIFRQK